MFISRTVVATTLAAVVILTALIVLPSSLNAFEPSKLMAIVVGAVACGCAVWVTGGIDPERLRATRVPLIVAGVFLTILFVAALLSPSPLAALVGSRSRWGGVALYAGCGGLFAVATMLDRLQVRQVLTAVAIAGGAVGAFGVLQFVGFNPLEGIGDQTGVPSTFGNINFAAGFVGASVGAMAWLLLDEQLPAKRRILGGILMVFGLAYIWVNDSFQGIPTAGAGIAVAMAGWAWARGGTVRRIGIPVLAGLAAVAAAVVGAGVVGAGPLRSLSEQTGIQIRRFYWDAAIEMIAGNPLLGVGPDRYVYEYRTSRSFEATQQLDLLLDNDAAHSVLLHFGTSGGVSLLLAFLALVGVVAWAAVRGMRAENNDPMLIFGAGSVMTAYLVQSLVSIDVPGLAMIGWVSFGLVVSAGLARLPVVVKSKRKRARKGSAARSARPAGSVVSWQPLLGSAVMVTVVLIVAMTPVRVESRSLSALREQQAEATVAGSAEAADLGFWDPRYRERSALAMIINGSDEGFETARELFEEDRLTASIAIRAAGVADDVGDDELAAEWYERALAEEPLHPDLRVDAATFFADAGDAERAEEVAAGLLADDPGNADAQAVLDRIGS